MKVVFLVQGNNGGMTDLELITYRQVINNESNILSTELCNPLFQCGFKCFIFSKSPLLRRLCITTGMLLRRLCITTGPLLRRLCITTGLLLRQLYSTTGPLLRRLCITTGLLLRPLCITTGPLLRPLCIKIGRAHV